MDLLDRQQIFAKNVSALIIFIFSRNFACTLGEAYRSKEQADIYAAAGKGIKDSLHCKRLAIDLNIFSAADQYLPNSREYQVFGSFWKGLHPDNRWGGDFIHNPDGNHFEMHDITHVKEGNGND